MHSNVTKARYIRLVRLLALLFSFQALTAHGIILTVDEDGLLHPEFSICIVLDESDSGSEPEHQGGHALEADNCDWCSACAYHLKAVITPSNQFQRFEQTPLTVDYFLPSLNYQRQSTWQSRAPPVSRLI